MRQEAPLFNSFSFACTWIFHSVQFSEHPCIVWKCSKQFTAPGAWESLRIPIQWFWGLGLVSWAKMPDQLPQVSPRSQQGHLLCCNSYTRKKSVFTSNASWWHTCFVWGFPSMLCMDTITLKPRCFIINHVSLSSYQWPSERSLKWHHFWSMCWKSTCLGLSVYLLSLVI